LIVCLALPVGMTYAQGVPRGVAVRAGRDCGRAAAQRKRAVKAAAKAALPVGTGACIELFAPLSERRAAPQGIVQGKEREREERDELARQAAQQAAQSRALAEKQV
jgi:hypothetical protein